MEPYVALDEVTPVEGLLSRCSPLWVSAQLRARILVPDLAFDSHLPGGPRDAMAPNYWTPLAVAMKAAKWFDEMGVRTVVDIGSGVGKFCVAAALTGHCTYTGLEQRSQLVFTARRLARLFECDDRVRFIEGAFPTVPLPRSDAYYLFNPFEENLYDLPDRLDGDVELSRNRYLDDVAATLAFLDSAPVGTVVITYNGFGALPPAAYRELRAYNGFSCSLQLWENSRSCR